MERQIHKPLDKENLTEVIRDAYFLPPYIDYQSNDYEIRALPDESLSNRENYVIEAKYKNIDAIDKFYIDKENYTLSQRVLNKQLTNGESETVTTIYGKYEPVDGVLMPFRAITKQNQKTLAVIDWTRIIPNQGIFDSYFEYKSLEMDPNTPPLRVLEAKSVK